MSSSLVLKLACGAVVAAVLLLARRSHHQSAAGVETFRYPAVFSWCALGGAILLGLAAAKLFPVIQAAAPTAPLPWMRILCYLVPWYMWLIAAMCAGGAIFLALHRIEVGTGIITVYGIRSLESIDPHTVRRFVEYRYRGLALYGESRRPVLRISWLIQDYDDLLDLIRKAMPREGIDYEVRGRFGQRID
jgi:hypothetical protein